MMPQVLRWPPTGGKASLAVFLLVLLLLPALGGAAAPAAAAAASMTAPAMPATTDGGPVASDSSVADMDAQRLAGPPVHVQRSHPLVDLRKWGRWWVAPAGQPEAALRALERGAPAWHWSAERTPEGQAVWGLVALDWSAPTIRGSDWYLRVPLPSLDRVTLWTRAHAAAPWQPETAGDLVPMGGQRFTAQSPTLQPQHTAAGLWLIELEHPSGSFSVPVQLMHLHEVLNQRLVSSLGAGALVGLAAALTLLALVEAARNRAWRQLGMAVFFVHLLLAMVVHTGVGDVLFWGEHPPVGHWLRYAVPVTLLGSFTWALVHAVRGWDRTPRVATTLLWWAGLMFVGGAVLPLLAPSLHAQPLMLAPVLATLCILAVYLGWMAWLGHRVFMAAFALALGIGGALLTLAYSATGWDWPGLWHAYTAGALMAGLLLFVRADRLADDRLLREGQAGALASRDLLTGLPNAVAAEYSYERIVRRARHFRAGGAALLLVIDNLDEVRQIVGHRRATEILVRLTARLRMVVRSVDLLAQLDEGQLLLLMEPPVTEVAMREQATRLLGAVMRDDGAGLRPRVAACNFPLPGEDRLPALMTRLRGLLAQTSVQRRIRSEWIATGSADARPRGPAADSAYPATLPPRGRDAG